MTFEGVVYLNDNDLEPGHYVVDNLNVMSFQKYTRQVIEKAELVIYKGDMGSKIIKSRFCSVFILRDADTSVSL